MPEKKAKLRTASDVISRLRWSDGEQHQHRHEQEEKTNNNGLVMMGYSDRIVGPLEKAVKDYVSAKTDGDIPEHRILYIRRAADDQPLEEQILWDRAGRVDRIFQSGNGPDAPVAPETLKAVREAKVNMIRVEQEQEDRRKEKAKQRARHARTRELARAKLDSKNEKMISTENQSHRRFYWEEAQWYIYSSDEDIWTTGSASDNEARLNHKQDEDLVVVTWNVLFDIFDGGLETDELHLNCSRGATNPSQARWEMLASILHSSEPDLVSLQEATPAFVEILLKCKWIQAEYACSASPSSLQSVNPSGVLLLWNRSTLAPHSKDYALFQCSDFGRNRSLVATLVPRKKSNGSVLAVCSAHLPADKAILGETEKSSRVLARKLELSSILGQLQRLREQLLSKRAVSVTPVVAGDFNCEDDELLDGLFAGSSDHLYRDVWPECEEGPGLTFDPANNRRAARSSALVGGDGGSKRIDRIFVGPTYTCRGHLRACNHMIPKSTTLLGNEIGIMAPSDHFGVRALFQFSLNGSKAVLSTYEHSLWAANAPRSPHYMLAVILDNPKIQVLKAQNDRQSSLRALHVTLLHGFVQADFGCMDLVKSAINNVLHSVHSCAPPPESLVFTKDNSLGVFEHRASATLVAYPDIDSQGSQWLRQLYNGLRGSFQLCDEQERLSSTGWNPHVTMGVFGSSSAARKIQAEWITNGSWNAHQEHAAIHSVDILRRGASNAFQTLASFPIYTQHLTRTTEDFLMDAGASMSRHMDQQVARVLSRLTRACHDAVQDYPVETSVHVVGSALLKTALPALSDVDTVVILQPRAGNVNAGAYIRELVRENSYLQRVAMAMTEDFPNVRARLRPGGGTVILTIRIPDLPLLDIMLCCLDINDKPIDEFSENSLGAIKNGNAILQAFSQHDLTSAFQGAVRIIKLWAHQHDVYGAMTGYLGGGGWTIWLAQCVLEGIKSGDLVVDSDADVVEKAQQIVCFFFERAAKTNHLSKPITLDSVHEPVASIGLHRAGTLSVLAPCFSGDFGRSSTLATTHATLTELRAAASTLQENKNDLAPILTAQTRVSSLLQFRDILVFELDINMAFAKSPAEAKAWGCQKFLEVLTELEKLCDPTQLRPMPKPLRLGTDWKPLDETLALQGFAWWIGLYGDSDALSEKVKAIASNLSHDATVGLHCTFHVVSSSDSVGRLVKIK